MGKTFGRAWNLIKEENGQALIITAVSMFAIMAFAGLGIDVGRLRSADRQIQAAADAAAIAGALEVDYCEGTANCTVMQTAAQRALVENNLPGSKLVTQCGSSNSSLVLTLNNGPCALGSTSADPNYGNAQYVEAVVSESVPTFFARVMGIDTVNISARSEAAMGNSPFCLYVGAGNAGAGSLTMTNGGQLTTSCGVQDDGSLQLKNGVHISTTIFNVAGSVTGNSNQVTPAPVPDAPMLPDPLSWVPTPTNPGNCQSITVSSNQTINPGCYNSISVTGGTLTLSPGLYYMQGNVTTGNGTAITTQAVTAGSTDLGVTFYFSSGTFNLSSGSNITLYAPNGGADYGILMYQSASDSSTFDLDSGASSTWQGALYLPGAEIDINSGGNLAAYTIVDAGSVNIDSGAKFSIGDNYSSLPSGSPAKGVTAVLTE